MAADKNGDAGSAASREHSDPVDQNRQAAINAAAADKSNLHKKWSRIVSSAGIEPITIHDLRRTGITRALLDNMPIVVVKDPAGHEKIDTTMPYYEGVKKRNLREAVQNRRKVG